MTPVPSHLRWSWRKLSVCIVRTEARDWLFTASIAHFRNPWVSDNPNSCFSGRLQWLPCLSSILLCVAAALEFDAEKELELKAETVQEALSSTLHRFAHVYSRIAPASLEPNFDCIISHVELFTSFQKLSVCKYTQESRKKYCWESFTLKISCFCFSFPKYSRETRHALSRRRSWVLKCYQILATFFFSTWKRNTLKDFHDLVLHMCISIVFLKDCKIFNILSTRNCINQCCSGVLMFLRINADFCNWYIQRKRQQDFRFIFEYRPLLLLWFFWIFNFEGKEMMHWRGRYSHFNKEVINLYKNNPVRGR